MFPSYFAPDMSSPVSWSSPLSIIGSVIGKYTSPLRLVTGYFFIVLYCPRWHFHAFCTCSRRILPPYGTLLTTPYTFLLPWLSAGAVRFSSMDIFSLNRPFPGQICGTRLSFVLIRLHLRVHLLQFYSVLFYAFFHSSIKNEVNGIVREFFMLFWLLLLK